MDTPCAEIHPTQDCGISSSLLPRHIAAEDTHFVDWCNDDSTDKFTLWAESFDNDIKQAVGKKSDHILHHLLDVYLR